MDKKHGRMVRGTYWDRSLDFRLQRDAAVIVVWLIILGCWIFGLLPSAPSTIGSGQGLGRVCEKFHQLLAVGRWFPPPENWFHHQFTALIWIAVAEALNSNKPNQGYIGKLVRWASIISDDQGLTKTNTAVVHAPPPGSYRPHPYLTYSLLGRL